jgi:hypothetical protein
VRDYLQRGVVRNAVNLPSVSAEDLEVLRPFIVLAEKLGQFQGQVATGGISEIEVEYAGEIAGLNAADLDRRAARRARAVVRRRGELRERARDRAEAGRARDRDRPPSPRTS